VTELVPEDFYHPAHRSIFRSMVALHDANQPVDLHTLADHLNTHGQLDSVGGPEGLAEIGDYEATAANVLHHAGIVRDKALKRRLIAVATGIAERVYEERDPGQTLLDEAEGRILEVGQQSSRKPFQTLEAEMHDAIDFIEDLIDRGGALTGLPTGFAALDKKTGGLQPGELIIVAARPSMGKTAFALNLARNAAVDHGKKVAVFSLEMTRRSLALRLIAAEAKYNSNSFRTGFIPERDHKVLVDAASALSGARIWIDDSTPMSILEIKAKSRRLQAEHGLDLVIVDYLQLATAEKRSNERREQEISEISRGLKGLAKELHIPVLALSQLNRGPELRPKKTPQLSDLRESGAIEQDADVIAFIYREYVYNEQADVHAAELIVAKQRNGPIGSVRLHFEPAFALFTGAQDADDEWTPGPARTSFDEPGGDSGSEPPF
jgi:replicative DNA helicase